VLARTPYGSDGALVCDFNHEEAPRNEVGSPREMLRTEYCWMNSAYVLAVRLGAAFARDGWCTAIQGLLGGGAIAGLPMHLHVSDDGDMEVTGPAEIDVCGRREGELAALGFACLVPRRDTGIAVFRSLPTAHEGGTGSRESVPAGREAFSH